MFDGIAELFQIDWQIFRAGVAAWLKNGDPYGPLGADLGAGAFAYPPTALTWLVLFIPLGGAGYYVWTALQLAGWWALVRTRCPQQMILLLWSPVILHLLMGQSTLPVVLVLWAAFRAPRRGWLWGVVLAWTLTKPQVALLPVLWLLWQDRGAPLRWQLVGGIVLGTLVLALPPTLHNPGIWADWLDSLGNYRDRLRYMAAWQGPSVVLLLLAAYLWHRSQRGGWHWWLPMALFPQTSFYGLVMLLPVLRPRFNAWFLGGFALAAVVQGPASEVLLPWILAIHLLAAWMIAGGPQPAAARQSGVI